MGKTFHTLSIMNKYEKGVLIEYQLPKTNNKENKMTNIKDNEFQKNNVPSMPKLFEESHDQDIISLVMGHLTEKHGDETRAKAALKNLGGNEILILADSLKQNKQEETSIAFRDEKSGFEAYSMPKMRTNGR